MFDIHTKIQAHIAGLEPYSSARDEYKGDAKIWLDANELPEDSGYNRYPNKDLYGLKAKISNQYRLSEDQFIIGNGSDEILDLIIRLFCKPERDNIITMPPSYSMYEVLAKIQNVHTIKVPLDEDFEINTSECLNAITGHTKLIMVCSPNNPTGKVASKNAIKILLQQDAIVVIDEAYIQFSDAVSWISELEKYPNLIVTQTLSKAYGLAGLRLGLCFASSKIIHYLNIIKAPYNVNVASAKAAMRLMKGDAEIELLKKQIKEQRTRLIAFLKGCEWAVQVYPSEANFVLVRCNNSKDIKQFLASRGIIVRDRSSQYRCDNCIRITIGSTEEMDQLIITLKTYQA